MNLRIASYTLGCKVNQYETEAMVGDFLEHGFCRVPFKEKADLYLINTCTVTAKSDKESKYAVRQAGRFNPEAKIIVTGCLAQRCPELLTDLAGVILIAGNTEKGQIFELFKKASDSGNLQVRVSKNQVDPSWKDLKIRHFSKRTRAFVKIQDGCDAHCRYCLVPQVRGKIISRPFLEVLEEVRRLIKQRFKEIVLTGIRLGKYGRDLNPGTTLAELLKNLEKEEKLFRIRLSSLEPGEFRPALIRQIARSRKICPHFHIPLQSGDNWILSRMGRSYTRKRYLDLLKTIKQAIPQATFGTDIIVGFPGEENKHFQNTVDLIREIGFIHLHIFTFSSRESTPAASFPGQIPLKIKRCRSRELSQIASELQKKYRDNLKDKSLEVLVEKKDKEGNLTGLTANYFRLSFPGDKSLVNHLVEIRNGQPVFNKDIL